MKCLHCGSSLDGKRFGAKYCSAKCRVYAGRERKKLKVNDLNLPSDPVDRCVLLLTQAESAFQELDKTIRWETLGAMFLRDLAVKIKKHYNR